MWTYELCKMNGDAIGELQQASNRQVVRRLNGASTATCTIRATDEFMPELFAAEDRLLRVWEGKELRFYGDVLTAEFADGEANTGSTVKLSAVDPTWRLSKRLVGLSSGGTSYTGDKAKTARKIISEISAISTTGIKLKAEGEYSAGGSGTYVGGPYKSALACINDLAHGFDGFDWFMEPIYKEDPMIGTFQAAATIGNTTSPVVLERGFGRKNVRSMNYVRDKTNMVNIAFHLPDEGVETVGATVLSKFDAASIAARNNLEGIADGYNLTNTTIRNMWLEEFIRVRANPRYVVSMSLDIDDGTGRVPKFGKDFNLGDMPSIRAMVGDVELFDGRVRVYAVTFDINDAGTATVIPTLIDEEGETLAS